MAQDGNASNYPPYELIGGAPVVRRIVDRFYDLMDSDPAFAELRALHAADLTPMRASLAGFLKAWLGGPHDWFVDHQGKCVMSLHGSLPITPALATQWTDAMRRAIAECSANPDLAPRLANALGNMALAMVRRSAEAA